MKILKYILLTLCIAFGCRAQAQDFILSQPYAGSLFLGPSFAGMTDGGRVFLTYRNQWPELSGGYNTALLGGDYFFRRQNSSVGAYMAYDRQAGGIFTTIELHPQYNYRVQLSKNLFFRPGVELSIYYKAINPDKLVFADQIAVDGTIMDVHSFENLNRENDTKVDVGVSGLLYNNDFWAGVALSHLTQTEVTFVNDEAKTPVKMSVMGGYRIVYNKDRYFNVEDDFTLAALIQYQSPYTQLQIGTFWHRLPIELGLFYRDLPFIPKDGLMNRDALICIVGLNIGNFKVSYSYDISLSKLSGFSGGAHELALSLKFNQKDEHDISFFCY